MYSMRALVLGTFQAQVQRAPRGSADAACTSGAGALFSMMECCCCAISWRKRNVLLDAVLVMRTLLAQAQCLHDGVLGTLLAQA